jgi:hypothetical protein
MAEARPGNGGMTDKEILQRYLRIQRDALAANSTG